MENNEIYSEEIEKVINQKNTSCAMYDTPECAFLNAETCSECPVGKLKTEKQESAKKALSRLMEAAPQEEIEPLYTSPECLFCKGERNKAEMYGLADLSKPDPEGDWTIAIGKKKLGVKAADMILPLQISACKSCAKKHRLLAYLPMLIGVIIAAAGLFITTATGVYNALYDVASYVPALVMAGFVILAVIACFAAKLLMQKSFGRKTHLDITEIAELEPFFEKGFKEVADRKLGVSQVVFSKTFREHGVGSLVTGAPDCGGGEEPVLMGIWPAEMKEFPEEEPGSAEDEPEAPEEDGAED